MISSCILSGPLTLDSVRDLHNSMVNFIWGSLNTGFSKSVVNKVDYAATIVQSPTRTRLPFYFISRIRMILICFKHKGQSSRTWKSDSVFLSTTDLASNVCPPFHIIRHSVSFFGGNDSRVFAPSENKCGNESWKHQRSK